MATKLENTPISDVLLHLKDDDKNEHIILPVTRYENILNAPNVVYTAESKPGAPFHILATETETLSANEIREICGPII